jgi:hypothetical protein
MITYEEVLQCIVDALTGRPSGQKVLVGDHEAAEKKLLDYIQQFVDAVSSPPPREAHAFVNSNEETQLRWNIAFDNEEYSFVVNGFDGHGGPVEVILLSQQKEFIVIKTFVKANVMALSFPHSYK